MKLRNKMRSRLILASVLCMSLGTTTIHGLPFTTREVNIQTKSSEPIIYGANDLIIEKGMPFDAYAGVTAFDQYGNNITHNIKVTHGYIVTTEIGEYEFIYQVSDGAGSVSTLRRKVVVAEKNTIYSTPELYGVGDKIIQIGEVFDPMVGVTASDDKDGDITSRIRVRDYIQSEIEGSFVVVYEVSNSQGIKTIHHRFITLEGYRRSNGSDLAPTIKGLKDIVIGRGDMCHTLAGVKAYDYQGKDITDRIVVSGDVRTNTAGVYTLTYSVIDDIGRLTTATRRVIVLA